MFLAIFISSFVYVHSFWHIVAIMLSYLFTLWALLKIKKDLRLNVKISLWKSIRTGSTLLLIALSMMITSQYYFEVKDLDSAHLIPQFNIGAMSGGLTSKIIAATNPGFKNLDQEGLTVDQFVLESAKSQAQDQGSDDMNNQIDQMIEKSNPKLTQTQKNLVKEDALKKVNSTYIMAIGLFLTVLPLGSLLNTLWMLVVELVIWIFIRFEVIRITKIPVEMEVIE